MTLKNNCYVNLPMERVNKIARTVSVLVAHNWTHEKIAQHPAILMKVADKH